MCAEQARRWQSTKTWPFIFSIFCDPSSHIINIITVPLFAAGCVWINTKMYCIFCTIKHCLTLWWWKLIDALKWLVHRKHIFIIWINTISMRLLFDTLFFQTVLLWKVLVQLESCTRTFHKNLTCSMKHEI